MGFFWKTRHIHEVNLFYYKNDLKLQLVNVNINVKSLRQLIYKNSFTLKQQRDYKKLSKSPKQYPENR